MSIKGLIFDLDGTLIDSMSYWENAGKFFLKTQNITELPEDFNEKIRSQSFLDATIYMRKFFQIEMTSDEIIEEIIKIMECKYNFEIPLKDGVLNFLEKHKHMKMCIATATHRTLALSVLKRLRIMDYFEFIITSSEAGDSKHYPTIYIKALEKLNLDIDEVIVFEDSFHAIKTAKTAGFHVIAVEDFSAQNDIKEIKQISDSFVTNLELEVIL